MPVLCDFQQIIGDTPQAIPAVGLGVQVPLPSFDTGGRDSGATAFLILSARNLTGTADVLVNNSSVGTITATSGSFWSTQMIHVNGNQLNNGNNTIALTNVMDAFELKTVMCFFHQSA